MRSTGKSFWAVAAPAALLGTVAAVAAMDVFALLSFRLRDTVDFLFDDVYYYLGVAKNLADGLGSKFDEPLSTNGYQPLLLLILAAGARIFGLTKLGLMVFSIVFKYAVHASALAVCLLSRNRTLKYLGLGLFTAIVLFREVFLWGLETSLLSVFVPGLYLVLRDVEEKKLGALTIGAFFSLLFLVRLDALSLFIAYSSIAVVVNRRIDGRLLRIGAVVGFTCIAYFGINWLLFGIAVPVSGVSKSIGNRAGENIWVGLNYLESLEWPAAIALTTYLIDRFVLGNQPDRGYRYGREIICCLSALGISFLYYGILSGWRLWGWYFWPSALLTAFLAARLYQSLRLAAVGGRWRPTGLGAKLLVAVCLIGMLAGFADQAFLAEKTVIGAYVKNSSSLKNLDVMARLLKSRERYSSFNKMNLDLLDDFFARQPPGIVLMGDRAGGLGYFLPNGFGFIHLEGLVGSAEFAKYRREGRGVEFLDRYAPKYLVVDREQYLEFGPAGPDHVFGVAEPINGLSVHSGTMLFCFPESAILTSQQYVLALGPQVRYVFDYGRKIACPPSISARLAQLEAQYGGLRAFSIPSEYGPLQRALHLPF